ncbi:MAG: ABC transporter ATP-binding protein [Burkholderiales bacterium]
MNTDPIIRVENVSKCYHVYERPQDRLKQALVPRRLGNWFGRDPGQPFYREFWALRDVSFEVRPGEAVGLIGRNGAGKSTLLQIIAGTLNPTSGEVRVRGKVAALLELGSGFSPDFTGRENVRLNGALLGLTPRELEERFDEIAAFADIGDFIDQPVKTYSSGMLMRLAFAVQTAVRPEILIVDEALAVGDVFFQAKCMARLRELLDGGVSLLFVSHDTATVRQLCDRAIFLAHGAVMAAGRAGEVTDRYLRLELEDRNRAAVTKNDAAGRSTIPRVASAPVTRSLGEAPSFAADVLAGRETFAQRAQFNRVGNHAGELINVQMLKDGALANLFDYDEQVVLRVVARFREPMSNVNVAFKLRTPQGVDVVFADSRLAGELERDYAPDRLYAFDWTFRVPMIHGNYCVFAAITQPPARPGDDWQFVDVVPLAYDFRMAPRREGMIDAFVVLENQLDIRELGYADHPDRAAA